eukprot:Skav217688  [mRNA]  locus=scaffold2051:19337:24733:+ [translate_table: standard]
MNLGPKAFEHLQGILPSATALRFDLRSVLNTESAYVVPSNASDNVSMMAEHKRHGLLSAWRRPVHSAWCRVLLLVSNLVSSKAASPCSGEVEMFLQVYRNRFCYIFQSALQSGRLAAARLQSLDVPVPEAIHV